MLSTGIIPEHVQQHATKVLGVPGRRLEDGQGEQMLFLHGAAGLTGWLPFFGELAKHWRLLVPEHPGFGTSPRPGWITSISDLASYYERYVEDLGPVHLVGSSFGGWLAGELALRSPNLVRSLTLIAPAGMRPRAPGSGVGALPTREARVRRLYYDQRLADATLAQQPTAKELDIEENNWKTTALLGGPTFHNPNLASRVSRIQKRSLLLWGREDAVIKFDQASAWLQALPQSEVAAFDECGHLPHVEKVRAAADAVARFLS